MPPVPTRVRSPSIRTRISPSRTQTVSSAFRVAAQRRALPRDHHILEHEERTAGVLSQELPRVKAATGEGLHVASSTVPDGSGGCFGGCLDPLEGGAHCLLSSTVAVAHHHVFEDSYVEWPAHGLERFGHVGAAVRRLQSVPPPDDVAWSSHGCPRELPA